jgi:nitrite reductase (NO-forming)
MSSYSATPPSYPGGERYIGLKLFAVLGGLLIPFVIAIGAWLALSAHNAATRADKAAAAAEQGGSSMAGMPGMSATPSTAAAGGAVPTPSFAGVTPENADTLAMAHEAFPAELPAAPAGPVARFTLDIQHRTIEIAPGIKYEAWTFGPTVPGPVIHVRQGQTVEITLRNSSPMPHSVDFHAARIAPNLAFSDVLPGKTKTLRFVAGDAGVFMYHCGTAPAFMHIANGMYGAIVVEPKTMPKADREYVLVSSEFYLDRPGDTKPASLDLVKANQMTPDWVTWNGYAGQYKTHPLTADPGQTVRFWVVAAGPSLDTRFHVVGTLLDRAWLNQDLIDAPQHDVQTALVAAGGGGVFDVKIDQPGIYPFVSHSFASVNMGQVGLLKVGDVPGTMSH